METISRDSIISAFEDGFEKQQYTDFVNNISKYLQEPSDEAQEVISEAKNGQNDGLTVVFARRLAHDLLNIVQSSVVASDKYSFGLRADGTEEKQINFLLRESLTRKANIDFNPNTYLQNSQKIVQLLSPFVGEDKEANEFGEETHVFSRIKDQSWITIDPSKIKKQDIVRCFREISALN